MRRKRKRPPVRKIIFGSTLACFVALAFGFVIGNNIGFYDGRSVGRDEGYDNGYTEGHDEGFDLGRTYGYNVWNPTHAEMLGFISLDGTDQIEYDEIEYNCFNYTADVIANAARENIKTAFVYIALKDGAHSIVAFDTIDQGLIFVEPQSDREVRIEVGTPY